MFTASVPVIINQSAWRHIREKYNGYTNNCENNSYTCFGCSLKGKALVSHPYQITDKLLFGVSQVERLRVRDPTRRMHFNNLPNPSSRTRPRGLLSL
jgi:hypothetical protein